MSDAASDDLQDHSPASAKSKRRFDLVDIISSRLPMGPRKKSKQNTKPKNGVSTPPSTSSEQSSKNQASSSATTSTPIDVPASKLSTPSKTSLSSSVGAGSAIDAQVSNRGAWYGSWRGKAQPTAEVAKESVEAEGRPEFFTSNSQLSKSATPNASPSPRRYLSGQAGSYKATPLAASMTNLNISSNGKTEGNEDTKMEDAPKEGEPAISEPPPAPEARPSKDAPEQETQPAPKDSSRPTTSSGWFGGWWSRPDDYQEPKKGPVATEQSVLEEAKNKPLPGSTPLESPAQSKLLPSTEIASNGSANGTADLPKPEESDKKPVDDSRSWFGLWSKAQNSLSAIPSLPLKPDTAKTKTDDSDASKATSPAAQAATQPKDVEATVNAHKDGADEQTSKDKKDGGRRKATGWAFWSSETGSTPPADGSTHKQIGELAVADTPSQSAPEAAQFNEQEQPAKVEPPPPKSTRGRSKAKDKATISSSVSTPSESPARTLTEAVVAATSKPDLLLPQFANTYSFVQQPSVWNQIKEYFVGSQPSAPHLHLLSHPPKIKKAVAIGIHGFFPAPLIQKVLGPPTGTSIRFANNAAQSIKTWTEKQGYECEIEKVALEGEGFITDRIETLWKLLLNWIEHIRSADFILVACHSQGVPVAIMLIAKLIQFGCISSARVGVCAMAGINQGPFAEYRTRMFGGTALELFEFSNPSSRVSKMYLAALETVLMHGVKVCYIGSLDDQLVSVESSTFSTVSHPCIYRAVFVDGRLHASDFITELVGFSLKLRNLGLSDHGLIRELSPALAGSLYGGEGHSRLYDSQSVYDLAVSHTLETTSPSHGVPVSIDFASNTKESNPFFLPWAMRGILEEEKVRKELGDECRALFKSFDEWRPVTKGLKDVKFRLAALQSKL